MIAVIIPALNEEKTIGKVVHLAKNSVYVTEVLVVGDKSKYYTIDSACNEGATVIGVKNLARYFDERW